MKLLDTAGLIAPYYHALAIIINFPLKIGPVHKLHHKTVVIPWENDVRSNTSVSLEFNALFATPLIYKEPCVNYYITLYRTGNQDFYKHTTVAIVPRLLSEALLYDNKKIPVTKCYPQ